MSVPKNLYEKFINLNYEVITQKDNFTLSKAGNIYLIKGISIKSQDKIINHLTSSQELVKYHPSIVHIEDLSEELRFIRVKPKMKYVEMSYVDRLENWKKIVDDNIVYFISKLVPLTEEIKNKTNDNDIIYIEEGLILGRIENNNVEVFIKHDTLEDVICDIIAINFLIIIIEFEKSNI
ncbi:hypothetical protein CPAV1605_1093 [seawater metagenome]|uniref:Uncharacterized protein n=1 Tax=seawater metagenome TaxID=1561972 RepID=A0A5E8CM38_9ZZZZ